MLVVCWLCEYNFDILNKIKAPKKGQRDCKNSVVKTGCPSGAGFTKPCALLKLDFLTSAYNKCMALVRKSSFSKAQGLRETGPR